MRCASKGFKTLLLYVHAEFFVLKMSSLDSINRIKAENAEYFATHRGPSKWRQLSRSMPACDQVLTAEEDVLQTIEESVYAAIEKYVDLL